MGLADARHPMRGAGSCHSDESEDAPGAPQNVIASRGRGDSEMAGFMQSMEASTGAVTKGQPARDGDRLIFEGGDLGLGLC